MSFGDKNEKIRKNRSLKNNKEVKKRVWIKEYIIFELWWDYRCVVIKNKEFWSGIMIILNRWMNNCK